MNVNFTKLICILLFIQILAAGFNTVYAQGTYSVKGKVSDQTGAGIPGANIKVAGTSQGTVTDNNGAFIISLSAPATLQISYIGYTQQAVPVTSSTQTLDIKLSENEADKNLNEVVVVGYGTQKKSDITGAVTSIPKSRLSQLPVTNVLQAIQGAAAGVNVSQTSSVPGAQPSALVRGQNSINATTGPYVVVDGIPLSKTGGSLNDINPNDIASVEILKDASAVAIYGTNGSNGVILITTKRGTTGKPVIRYNAYAGVENMAHILKPRNGAEYVQKYADWSAQTGQTQINPVPNFGELANYNAGITTDWIDEATQTGVMQDHNVSISGGTEDVKYFISGDYLDQKGVVKGYNFKRTTIRSNLDVDVTDFLTIGTSLFVTNNNTDGGRVNFLFAGAMSPYGEMFNPNGTYKIHPMQPEQLFTNPMLGLLTDRINRSTNLNGNAFAEVKFSGVLEGLKYRLNAGYTYLPARRASYVGRLANDFLGTAENFNAETNSYTVENLLTYNKDFGKHHIDFTGLYSNQQRKYIETTARAVGFVNDELSFNNLGAGAAQSSASYADRYALVSQMGRINYSYDSRYLFTLTARRDGSSVFGSNTTKYGVFPSAAIGWNVSNEAFMEDVKFVNNLKLRLSHGKSGNEAISVYRTITTNGIVRQPFNGVSTIGAVASNLGNVNLLWETTLSTNLGVDFSLFNNRVSGSVDAYKTKTTDILLLRSLPIITGYNNVFDNLGEVDNKGIEINLTTKNLDKGEFKWESTFNFATNRNKLIDLYGDKKSDLGNRWFIGQPISVIYDYRLQGVWQTGEDPSKQDPGAKPGDLKFADLNDDGVITADDREVLGQQAPKWTGGLTNTFHYKNLHLNIFIQTAQGMTRNNNDLNYGDETGKRNTPAEVGYWTPTNGNNSRPALSYNNTRGYGYASDAGYTRIKDVTLSYVFGAKTLEKLRLGSLTIYGSGRNLHTFTNWIGWDPEGNYAPRGSGDWVDNYPVTRTFVFGVNVTLR
ncbi:TonB-linked SusC/RagA family outer membrane protein [Pedobacter sp. CAN_A7]|uniref:SusC/RagA family TonB-linked outer membrane protein n=1 Tax=Pedobacter sp. CAN_A7 TaxID=2787722 RepID=UPI0018CA6510